MLRDLPIRTRAGKARATELDSEVRGGAGRLPARCAGRAPSSRGGPAGRSGRSICGCRAGSRWRCCCASPARPVSRPPDRFGCSRWMVRSARPAPITWCAASSVPPRTARNWWCWNWTRPAAWTHRCGASSRRSSPARCRSPVSSRPAGRGRRAPAPTSCMPAISRRWRRAPTSALPPRCAWGRRTSPQRSPRRGTPNPWRASRSTTPPPISVASRNCGGATSSGPSARCARRSAWRRTRRRRRR